MLNTHPSCCIVTNISVMLKDNKNTHYCWKCSMEEISQQLFDKMLICFMNTVGVRLSRIPADEMLSNSSSLLSLLLGNMLPAIAFSLKFLQWWYSGNQRWVGLGGLPAPPPPSAPPPHPQGVRVTSSPAHCALCEYPYTTPTALQTSGHVFCYTCIHDYVRKHGCCPVTKQPTSETQLIRLFVQS